MPQTPNPHQTARVRRLQASIGDTNAASFNANQHVATILEWLVDCPVDDGEIPARGRNGAAAAVRLDAVSRNPSPLNPSRYLRLTTYGAARIERRQSP